MVNKAMEYIGIQMEISMMANGKMTWKMGMVQWDTLPVPNMRENGSKVKNMEMEYTTMKMESNIMVDLP